MANDHVVLDCEIQKCIGEDGLGWYDTDKLGVSSAVVWEEATDRFLVYGPDDLKPLRERIMAADRVTGFNTWKFDMPLVWGVHRSAWDGLSARDVRDPLAVTANDLLRRIWQSLGLNPDSFSRSHGGWGLDAVCRGTLGRGKSGHGADAPKLFQSGQWAKLVSYNLDDVALTRDLSRFIDRYGYVVNGKTGQILQMKEIACPKPH